METQSKEALKTVTDYYGSIPALQRELSKYFHAFVSTDDFTNLNETERRNLMTKFEFLLDFFDTLKN